MSPKKKKGDEPRPEVVEQVATIIEKLGPYSAARHEQIIVERIPDVRWNELLDGHNLAWKRRQENV